MPLQVWHDACLFVVETPYGSQAASIDNVADAGFELLILMPPQVMELQVYHLCHPARQVL